MRFLRWITFVLPMCYGLILAGEAAARIEDSRVATPVSAPNFEFHNRDTQDKLSVKSMISRTTINGPVAMTDIEFIAENKFITPIEVACTFEVPSGTVLTKFGYFYGDRFIPGKMYDKGEAWKIYSAVTSRGRDPGIMDRPSETNYHAQIFPVAPNKDLRVHITLVQMLHTDRKGLQFELPLVQGGPYLNGWNEKPFLVDAKVQVAGNSGAALEAVGETEDGVYPFTLGSIGTYRTVRFQRSYSPHRDLIITMPYSGTGIQTATFSRMVGTNEGYYAVTVATPKRMGRTKATLISNGLTGQSLPTLFNATDAYSQVHIVGRYSKPGTFRLRLRGENGTRISVPITLSGQQVAGVTTNPAASLWADKRISLLQTSARPNIQRDTIALSQRFMVVSNFTALLAIPKEELDYYRNVLAKQKVQTNTNTTGGGGGDPYIAVHAPADCVQVVAVFPDGVIKNLTWNTEKKLWDGRFDIPFGTPEGEYKVTILVVQHDGKRNSFALIYQNRRTGPGVHRENLETLTAERGQTVTVSIEGTNIQRATAITPWGDRVPLTDTGSGRWSGEVTVPLSQPIGSTELTIILLDGAHNSTEVTVDVDVE